MIRRVTIRVRVVLLVCLPLLGLSLFAFLSRRTLDDVKVTGPVYAGIVQNKDVIADILPPPEFVIESYLVVLQMLGETEPTALIDFAKRGQQLRKEFDDRHQYWERALPDGVLRTGLI